jgi:DNA polymerase-3 subunit epsilon
MLHFVDTETTGLDCTKHEIIEIAIITEMGDGTLERWCTKIKPVRLLDADPKALEVNGYNDADWSDAPLLPEVIEVIRDKLKDGIVVGHNVSFDVGFIRESYKRCGLGDSYDVTW